MDLVPRIGRSERRDLLPRGRKSGDLATALRFWIVAQLGLRKTSCEVESELGVARATVVRTAHRYAEQGIAGLYDQRSDNGNPKGNDGFRHRVVALLRRTPEDLGWRRPTWTRELLCLQMTAEGWPPVAVTTMSRVLARIGLPKPIVLCPWKRDARVQRLAEIRAIEASASTEEPVLSTDEVDMHLNPKIGRDGMLRGEQRRIVTPGKNEKFYLAGALDGTTGVLHTTGAARKSAALFCDLLRLLASSYDARVQRIHLLVDTYGIHSAHATRRVLAELGGRIVLHFLPPYCPDANPIERVWQDLHANVTRNHRCKTMKALLGNAREYLEGYVWRRVTGLAPILSRVAGCCFRIVAGHLGPLIGARYFYLCPPICRHSWTGPFVALRTQAE